MLSEGALQAIGRAREPCDPTSGFGGCTREKRHQINAVALRFAHRFSHGFDEQPVGRWRHFMFAVELPKKPDNFPVAIIQRQVVFLRNNTGDILGPFVGSLQKALTVTFWECHGFYYQLTLSG